MQRKPRTRTPTTTAPQAVPQWITDLQQQHKHASRRELRKIISAMRDRQMREMQRIYK